MIQAPDALPHLLQQWFQEAREGSEDAVQNLLNTCRRYLLRKAKQLMPQDLQAKKAPSDLVQESLLTAHCNFKQFHGKTLEQYLAWLEEILRNHFRHLCREFRLVLKRQIQREISLQTPEPGDAEPLEDQLVSSDLSPSEAAIQAEEVKTIGERVQQLPPNYQRVLRLHFWDHHSFKEIGESMECSEEAARSTFRRAMKQLCLQLRLSQQS